MQSKIFLMSFSHIIGGGYSLKGTGICQNRGCPPGSVTITPVPTMYLFPLKSNSTQPLPQGRWVRGQGEEEEAKQKQGRGNRQGQLSRRSQDQSVDMWDGGEQGLERSD